MMAEILRLYPRDILGHRVVILPVPASGGAHNAPVASHRRINKGV